MMGLIDTELFGDIQHDLLISAEEWCRFPETEFLRRAHGWFGSLNKEMATYVLAAHSCDDFTHVYNPAIFLQLISAFNTKFLRTIDMEIAPSITQWPNSGDTKFGPIRLKTIRKTFQHRFSFNLTTP